MRSVVMRKIDNLGRIVLPKELRNVEQLVDGTEMDIFLNEDGTILLRKTLTHCRLCGSAEDVHIFRDAALCEICMRQIKEY